MSRGVNESADPRVLLPYVWKRVLARVCAPRRSSRGWRCSVEVLAQSRSVLETLRSVGCPVLGECGAKAGAAARSTALPLIHTGRGRGGGGGGQYLDEGGDVGLGSEADASVARGVTEGSSACEDVCDRRCETLHSTPCM